MLLQESVRAIDTVGRYGGDEFTILLVDTGQDGALSVADRIRQSVASHVFGGERGLDLRLTISVGVATFPAHGDTRERLLDLADKAMYLAKALGRNHVCSADDLSQSRGVAPPAREGPRYAAFGAGTQRRGAAHVCDATEPRDLGRLRAPYPRPPRRLPCRDSTRSAICAEHTSVESCVRATSAARSCCAAGCASAATTAA